MGNIIHSIAAVRKILFATVEVAFFIEILYIEFILKKFVIYIYYFYYFCNLFKKE